MICPIKLWDLINGPLKLNFVLSTIKKIHVPHDCVHTRSFILARIYRLGKYQPGVNKPDPKTWKANFRCAMNSLPDIEEVKDKSIKKGTNAFRVYKMLSASERQSKRGEFGLPDP